MLFLLLLSLLSLLSLLFLLFLLFLLLFSQKAILHQIILNDKKAILSMFNDIGMLDIFLIVVVVFVILVGGDVVIVACRGSRVCMAVAIVDCAAVAAIADAADATDVAVVFCCRSGYDAKFQKKNQGNNVFAVGWLVGGLVRRWVGWLLARLAARFLACFLAWSGCWHAWSVGRCCGC